MCGILLRGLILVVILAFTCDEDISDYGLFDYFKAGLLVLFTSVVSIFAAALVAPAVGVILAIVIAMALATLLLAGAIILVYGADTTSALKGAAIYFVFATSIEIAISSLLQAGQPLIAGAYFARPKRTTGT